MGAVFSSKQSMQTHYYRVEYGKHGKQKTVKADPGGNPSIF
jgi:hypothetical protein